MCQLSSVVNANIKHTLSNLTTREKILSKSTFSI